MSPVADRAPIWPGVVVLLAIACGVVSGAPDRADKALRDAGMFDVLEARLLSRIDGTDGDGSRRETVTQLAAVYEQMMGALETGSAERAAVVERAWALADRAGAEEAVGLRMALLIDGYLPIERAVALHEIGLLSDADHSRHAIDLSLIHRKLRSIAEAAVPEAVRQDRLARTSDDPLIAERAAESARLRSLSSYYAAWSGLMLSILEDRRPGADVLPAFGWLLAGEGGQPRLDDVRDSAFGLDHVARAAIGVARTKHRSGETVLAAMWLEQVTESSSTSDAIREQALLRRLRFLAKERAWSDLMIGFFQLLGTGDDRTPLPAGEARFHAIEALTVLRDLGSSGDAERVAAFALGDLVQRGEIGHVLDLRDRFGSLPTLEDGFVGRYADALDRLESAEDTGSPVRYLDAAKSFETASKASDAGRFHRQRNDARLKRVFCLIRAGRPSEAIKASQALLDEEPAVAESVAEEARWLLIVAIDSADDDRRRDELRGAVRDYLTRYRGTERARLLLVRHAGTDMLEPGEGLEGLREVGDDETIAVDAKRVLVRLLYKQWISGARRDDTVRAELTESVSWLWARGAADGDERQRLDIARVAIDVALGAEPRMLELAAAGIERAEAAMDDEPSLRVFAWDVLILRIEWLAASGLFDEADEAGEPLRQAADARGARGDRIVLAAALDRSDDNPESGASLDTLIARVGVRVVDTLIPPSPRRLDANTSGVVSKVVRAAARLGQDSDDHRQIALRLGRVLLERGTPTAQVVRDLAETAHDAGDDGVEMLAWSTLLSASVPEESAWWEARYETFRLLSASNRAKAEAAYRQHRVLHPMEGPPPWGAQIRAMFADMPDEAPSETTDG